jgi:CubicO group peptidase (beta-lactamase class C family)
MLVDAKSKSGQNKKPLGIKKLLLRIISYLIVMHLSSSKLFRMNRFFIFLFLICSGHWAVSQQAVSPGVNDGVVILTDTGKLIDKYLTTLASEKNFSGGLLIIKDGRKIFSKGYGWADREQQIPFGTGTLASMGSITKAFTAAAIMKLAEQGKLSVTDSLKKFFPQVPADKAGITIDQLLTHASGFHEFLTADKGDFEVLDREHFLARAFSEPPAFKPGEKAVYTNVGMSILAVIIEQVSNMDYETFLQKYLFEPVGIKNIGYHFPVGARDTIAHGYQQGLDWGTHQHHFQQAGGGPYWNLKGNGGLEASLNDMYLWANAFTLHSFLSEKTITDMFKAHISEAGTNGHFSFGYGCNISESRRHTLMIDNGGSNGIYFARLIRLPQEKMVFYIVTTESSINANMVLPNISQLYFDGRISQDMVTAPKPFENPQSKVIYQLIIDHKPADLATELRINNITVDDDMILLEAGRRLSEEAKWDLALVLYRFYTKAFPKIIVAWNDLGDVYQSLHQKSEAIGCYREALKLKPDNPRAKENLDKLIK